MKPIRALTALAAATLVLPAMAGSWPNLPARKAPASASQPAAASPSESFAVNGFQFVGGDAGWEPSQHMLVWRDGRLAHGDECDHALRTVTAPTPAEIDLAGAAYPGA